MIANIIRKGIVYKINLLSGITANGMIDARIEINNVNHIGRKPIFEICFLKQRIIPKGVKKMRYGNIIYDRMENNVLLPLIMKRSKKLVIP